MNTETASLAIDLPNLDRLPWYQRRLIDQFSRIRHGQLTLELGGQRVTLRGREAGPGAHIALERPTSLLRRLSWRGDLGFAESYMHGDWQTEDLPRLLELLALNIDELARSDSIGGSHWIPGTVEARVAFGEGWGVRVLAEGIEDLADADCLVKLGVEYGQGFALGRQ